MIKGMSTHGKIGSESFVRLFDTSYPELIDGFVGKFFGERVSNLKLLFSARMQSEDLETLILKMLNLQKMFVETLRDNMWKKFINIGSREK